MRLWVITLCIVEAVFGVGTSYAWETPAESAESCAPDTAPEVQVPAQDLAGIPDPKSKCISKQDVFDHVDRYYSPFRMMHGRKLAQHVNCWKPSVLKKGSNQWTDFKVKGNFTWDYLATGGMVPYPGADEHVRSLQAFVDSQKYFSISPEKLFKKAAEICGGNAQKALMTCWALLSDNWNTNVVARNLRSNTLKLESISGERAKIQPTNSEQRYYRNELQHIKDGKGSSRPEWFWKWKMSNDDVSSRGDEFSNWYHFFGTAIHAFAVETGAPKTDTLFMSTEKVVKTANWASNNLPLGENSNEIKDLEKREAFDFAGIAFGKQLAKDLMKNHARDEAACKNLRPYITEDKASSGLPDDWALAANQRGNDYKEDGQASRGTLNEIEKTLIVIGLKRSGDYKKMRCYLNELVAPIRKSDIKNVRFQMEHHAMFRAVLDTYNRDKSAEAKSWLKQFIHDTKPDEYSHNDRNSYCAYAAEIYERNFGEDIKQSCY